MREGRKPQRVPSTCAAFQGYRQEAFSRLLAVSVLLCTGAAQPFIASCAEAVGRFLLFAHGAALGTKKSAITHTHTQQISCTNCPL